MKFFRSRFFIACVASTVAALVVGGIAYTSIPAPNGSITACYNKGTGALHVINFPHPPKCPPGTTLLTWNQRGVPGPVGGTGPQGAPGFGFQGPPGATAGLFAGPGVTTAGVPGVVNNTGILDNNLETYFACTNGATTPSFVTVSLFNEDGTAGPTASLTIPVQGTGTFTTAASLGVFSDINLGAGTMSSGSARISAPPEVYCTAYVGGQGDPPSPTWSLPVINGIS